MMTLSQNPTLQEWALFWLELYVKPIAKPSGYEHYYDNMHKHILPKLGNIRLSKLTTPVIQFFLNEVSEHGNLRNNGPLSPKSVKNMRVVLDVCCKRAVADGYMSSNPVPGTVYKRCPSKQVEVMTDENQKILENWLFEDISLANAGIIQALYTGMRLGEVCALRWRNFDPQAGTIRIEETVRRISKNRKDMSYGQRTELVFSSVKTESSKRTLDLPEVLMELFALQYERFTRLFGREPGLDDFVFYNKNGGLMDPDNLSHYFGDVLEGLRLPHVKFHALRHTFATRAVEKHIDVATVAGILGHADVTTTTHYYLHPRQDAMRRVMTEVKPVTDKFLPRTTSCSFGSLVRNISEPPRAQRICRRRKNVA